MKIFIGIKKLLRTFGILKFKHSNAKIEKAINIFQNIVCFCVIPFLFLSPLWFHVFRAKTFYEKSFSFILSFSIFLLTIAYHILKWKREQIFELFTELESKILERNFNKNEKIILA